MPGLAPTSEPDPDAARGRIVVVGLGPAGGDHVLPVARAALRHATRRFLRTARHPAVADLAADGITFESFDAHYDTAPVLEDVYTQIVDELLAAAATGVDGRPGSVVYAVPGSASMAERTVVLLHEAAARGAVVVEVVPGLSFADLAWARVGIDPMATGARVVDGHTLADADAAGDAAHLAALATGVEVAGPMLVAQCDTRLVLSHVKLALLERVDADAEVVVLQRLGLPDEQVTRVALAELDRDVEPDHLTSVFVDAPPGVGAEVARLVRLSKRLRDPGGCPWDAEQTHRSLSRYLLEEAYEVVEVLEQLAPDAPGGLEPVPAERYAALADELGDLLYQVVFHAILAEEEAAFDLGDIARGIHDKLVRRHPHVFGDVDVEGTADVMRNWEQIKRVEKDSASIVAGITPGLPSLLYAHKLYRKAASVGLDPGSRDDALGRLRATITALQAPESSLQGGARATGEAEELVGETLAAAVVLARATGVDAESALRGWSARFRARFEAVETLALARGLDLAAIGPEAVAALWAEVGPPADGG